MAEIVSLTRVRAAKQLEAVPPPDRSVDEEQLRAERVAMDAVFFKRNRDYLQKIAEACGPIALHIFDERKLDLDDPALLLKGRAVKKFELSRIAGYLEYAERRDWELSRAFYGALVLEFSDRCAQLLHVEKELAAQHAAKHQ
jgi:hypothetical protein